VLLPLSIELLPPPRECRALAEKAEGLVTQDMSLALSLEQLRIATEQKVAAAAAAILVVI
jgi:hypothetical protein